MHTDLIIFLAILGGGFIGYVLGWLSGHKIGHNIGFRRGKSVGSAR